MWRCTLFVRCLVLVFSTALPCLASKVRAQSYGGRVEGWGQTYRPAGLVSLEARAHAYPWLSAETQVWAGRSPFATQGNGDVLVLAVRAQDPTGHGDARAGRFVLTTGAVRPVHLDGAHLRGRLQVDTMLEAFGGVPVKADFAPRAYDWLAGGRLSQRLGEYGTLGASYVERRDHGREIDEELGTDLVIYLRSWLSLSGRSSYDLVSRGLSEINVTTSLGHVERRIELFGVSRNPSLVLPATSLFSVLSNTHSSEVGTSGRMLVAPRLRVEGLAAYRRAAQENGAHLQGSATLWLDDEHASAVEGVVTRDGVGDSAWFGLRALFYRDVLEGLRVASELELVRPDHSDGKGKVWPWGRLSARYTLLEHWRISAGIEGSSSPALQRLCQALVSLSYAAGTL
jgi:hypothetical protein